MATVQPPGYIQALNTHTAETDRATPNVLVHGPRTSGSVLQSRGGINISLGGAFAVTQNGTPNMTVNVASGSALIPGSEGSKQAVYSVVNDATVNVSIAASDPTNPRIDLIVMKVQDAQYSGATNSWSIVAVTGTPAGSPTAPAAPNNSIIICQVAVAANTTTIVNANITDKRTFLAAAGGVIPCVSTNRPTNVPSGTLIFEIDTVRHLTWDGAAWQIVADVNAWTDFSSAALVVAFGGGMVKGSSTYNARYKTVGKMVTYSGSITINTAGGFAAGSGIWSFLLPVAAQASLLGAGAVQLVDNSTAIYSAVATLIDSTHFRIYKNGALTALDAGGPGTAWATNDQINWNITYEPA